MATGQRVAGSPATSYWELDPAHTSVEFSAKHMMITTVRGRFRGVKGHIMVDMRNPDDSRTEVEIDAASIDTANDKRDEHLRSGDFLDAEHHDTLTFRSTKVEGAHAREGDTFSLSGELTIRGESIPVTLECTYEGRGPDPWGGERIAFSASTTLDRRDWGLRWNQALETGGILVSNAVKVNVDVQAVRKEHAPG